MAMIWRAFLFLLILTSCSSKWHLKQSERHLKKAELKGAKVHVDTVFKTVSVIVPETRIDTVLTVQNFRDTIVVQKDKVITRIKYDTASRRLFIHTISPADTVRIEVPVQVIKEIKSGWPWWWLLVAGGIGAALFAVFKRSPQR